MANPRLSAVQLEVLRVLAAVRPRWTLSGGGALVGFHTGHRETRDLDLFWQGARELGNIEDDVRKTLEGQGLDVRVLQTEPAFARLLVRRGDEQTVLDLVADPVPLAETPEERDVGDARILVDTPHQILVNKLCALLGRGELRDMEDVCVLLDRAHSLERALADAPEQDPGFSPVTLAWILRQLPIAKLVRAVGREAELATLERRRDELVDRVLATAIADEGQGR